MNLLEVIKNFSSKMNDKVLHFAFSLIIALYSTECAICAGLAKEYGDYACPSNRWDWKDIYADGLGVLVGTVIRLLVFKRWNIF